MYSLELAALLTCLWLTYYFGKRWSQLRAVATLDDLMAPPAAGAPLARWLKTLDINLGPLIFGFGLIAVSALAFSITLTVFPAQILLALLGGATAFAICLYAVADMALGRTRKVEKNLLESLDLMRSAMTAGHSPYQALQAAAASAREPLKAELHEILRRFDMGGSAEQAISRLVARHPCAATKLFSQAMVARAQTNVDLGDMFGAVSRVLYERIRQQSAIDAQLSGSRYAALLCGLMPYALVPIFLSEEPRWLEALSQHPSGPFYFGVALALQLCGFLWLRRMLRNWR